MQAAARKPRTNHLDLAQSILDVARQRGFKQGARLPEQQIASLCKVSRTPVRAALRLLADRGLVERDPEAGYRLAADLSSQQAALPTPRMPRPTTPRRFTSTRCSSTTTTQCCWPHISDSDA